MNSTYILKTLLEQYIIISPGVIITDADLALMNVIGAVFPKPTTGFVFGTFKAISNPATKEIFLQ